MHKGSLHGRLASLPIVRFGYYNCQITNEEYLVHSDKDLDVVELWCGVGSIAAAASAAGYVVRRLDKRRVPGVTDQEGHASEDLQSLCGSFKTNPQACCVKAPLLQELSAERCLQR